MERELFLDGGSRLSFVSAKEAQRTGLAPHHHKQVVLRNIYGREERHQTPVHRVLLRIGSTQGLAEVLELPSLLHSWVLGRDLMRQFHLVPRYHLHVCEVSQGTELASAAAEEASEPLTSHPGSESTPTCECGNCQETEGLREAIEALDIYKTMRTAPIRYGHVQGINVSLRLIDTKPVKVKPKRWPKHEADAFLAAVDEMVRLGVVRPSTSPYAANSRLIPKKDGGMRPIVNYRPVNEKIQRNAGPLPNIDDIRALVPRPCIISTIDLSKGYWQLALDDDSAQLTAFNTPRGLYEYTVLPFGLSVAPAIFQSVMEETLTPLLRHCAVVYLDDILIFSKTLEEHLHHIEQTLHLLHARGFLLQFAKCAWGRRCSTHLGLLLTSTGLGLTQKSRERLIALEYPHDFASLTRFLGLTSYFRRFVERYSQRTTLLRTRQKKAKETPNTQFTLTVKELAEYRGLIRALTSSPVMMRPDLAKPFRIDTDACKNAVSAILYQESEEQFHVVEFFSRALTEAQQRWHSVEQEAYAIVTSLLHWRVLVQSHRVQIRTDMASLKWLLSATDGKLGR